MALLFPTPEILAAFASRTTIQNQATKTKTPFIFTNEQAELSAAVLSMELPLVLTVKSRQIGTSTFFCLLDVVCAFLNPGSKTGVIIDSLRKARVMMERIKDFCIGLGIELEVANTEQIKFAPEWGGSQILCLTANSDPRSYTFDFKHYTELDNWPEGAFASWEAAGEGAATWAETTADGVDNLVHKLWVAPNKFKKIFFGFEQHLNYQADPNSITNQEWLTCSNEYGFVSRAHAAYWLNSYKTGAKDIIAHRRDYPVKETDPFTIRSGRYIQVDPEVKPHQDYCGFKLFKTGNEERFGPIKTHRYLVAVDPAEGVGKDGSAVVVLDRQTREVAATWKDNTTDIIDLVAKLKTLNHYFKPDLFLIERNGVGGGVVPLAKQDGLPVKEVWTDNASKALGLQTARRAVESRQAAASTELLEECRSLHIGRGRTEPFKGAKDLLMALGMGLVEQQSDPYLPPTIKDPNIYYEEDYVVQYQQERW